MRNILQSNFLFYLVFLNWCEKHWQSLFCLWDGLGLLTMKKMFFLEQWHTRMNIQIIRVYYQHIIFNLTRKRINIGKVNWMIININSLKSIRIFLLNRKLFSIKSLHHSVSTKASKIILFRIQAILALFGTPSLCASMAHITGNMFSGSWCVLCRGCCTTNIEVKKVQRAMHLHLQVDFPNQEF